MDFVENQSELWEFNVGLVYLIYYMVILATTALSFTFHTTWGPKNKRVNVLAIVIHLEHYLKLVLNGKHSLRKPVGCGLEIWGFNGRLFKIFFFFFYFKINWSFPLLEFTVSLAVAVD